MKWRRVLVTTALFVCAAVAYAADVQGIKTVYLMPMAGGLDQYLAVRLTTGVILQVVTDPKKADAVMTDHLGESFEKSFDDLYGVAPTTPGDSTQSFARVQGGGQRARGVLFLVDRKTRDVVWSDDERPKGTSADDLRRMATRVASRLDKAMKGK